MIEQPEKILCGYELCRKSAKSSISTTGADAVCPLCRFQTAHNAPVLETAPFLREFDYEGELAVIIGKGGENIRREEALRHVAGYSCWHGMDPHATGSSTAGFTAGKTGGRPAHLARGWRPRMRSRIRIS